MPQEGMFTTPWKLQPFTPMDGHTGSWLPLHSGYNGVTRCPFREFWNFQLSYIRKQNPRLAFSHFSCFCYKLSPVFWISLKSGVCNLSCCIITNMIFSTCFNHGHFSPDQILLITHPKRFLGMFLSRYTSETLCQISKVYPVPVLIYSLPFSSKAFVCH